MKKLSLIFMGLLALNACKNSDEYAKASIDNFVEKTAALLESHLEDTPISQWHLDGDIIKTGHNKQAEFTLPNRQLSFIEGGKTALKLIFPETTIKATALKDEKVLLSSKLDFSQYGLELSEDMKDESETFQEISFKGHQDKERIYDINTHKLIKALYKTYSPQFSTRLIYDEKTLKRPYIMSLNLALQADDIVTELDFTPLDNEKNFDLSLQNQIQNYEVKKEFLMGENGPIFAEIITAEKNDLSLSWKNMEKKWLNRFSLAQWNNIYEEWENSSDDDIESRFNSFIDGLFKSHIKASYQETGTKVAYNFAPRNGIMALEEDPKNQEKMLTKLNEAEIDEDIFTFFYKENLTSNLEIGNEDDKLFAKFHWRSDILEAGHNIPLDKILPLYGEYEQKIRDWYELIISYDLKAIEFNIYAHDLKKTSEPFDPINFNFGQSYGGLDLKLETQKGFISLDVDMNITEENIDLYDFTPQHFELALKIQNFDDMLNPIAELEPSAGFFIKMFKGLGETDKSDASITLFHIKYDEKGKPKINGKAIPFL